MWKKRPTMLSSSLRGWLKQRQGSSVALSRWRDFSRWLFAWSMGKKGPTMLSSPLRGWLKQRQYSQSAYTRRHVYMRTSAKERFCRKPGNLCMRPYHGAWHLLSSVRYLAAVSGSRCNISTFFTSPRCPPTLILGVIRLPLNPSMSCNIE